MDGIPRLGDHPGDNLAEREHGPVRIRAYQIDNRDEPVELIRRDRIAVNPRQTADIHVSVGR